MRPVLWGHSHFLLPTGGTKYIFEVVRRLAERRPVEVVVERASEYWRERYASVGVPLAEISNRTSTSMAYWALFPLYLRRDSARVRGVITRGEQPTLVSSFFPLNTIFDRLGSAAGLRHVHLCFEPFPFFHDREVIGLYSRPKQISLLALAAMYGHLDRRGVRGADALLTLNRVTADSIARTYDRADAEPIYTGVDLDFFHPYSEAELQDLRVRFGNGPLAIHSTDFSPIKRTDLALRAFAAAAVPTARLLVTSTIDDQAKLASTLAEAESLGIREQVEYLGFVPYEDIPRLYSLADVLLQTGTAVNSGATSMSLPVKEALACETAVIRSHATDEDVEDGISGFLVDPNDSATTGARLRELLLNRERASRFGEKGAARIRSLYSWDNVVDLVDAAIGT